MQMNRIGHRAWRMGQKTWNVGILEDWKVGLTHYSIFPSFRFTLCSPPYARYALINISQGDIGHEKEI
jgi:hypothetical protein